jgi:hypothetical protein
VLLPLVHREEGDEPLQGNLQVLITITYISQVTHWVKGIVSCDFVLFFV